MNLSPGQRYKFVCAGCSLEKTTEVEPDLGRVCFVCQEKEKRRHESNLRKAKQDFFNNSIHKNETVKE